MWCYYIPLFYQKMLLPGMKFERNSFGIWEKCQSFSKTWKTHVPKLSKRWALICFPSISFCFILCLLATWNRLVPLAIGLFRCVRFFNQHKQRANVNLHDHELPQISYLTNNVLLLFYNQVPPCLPRTSLPQFWRVEDLEDHHCQPDCHQV